jgi:FtsZ-binding cell division protein ZapB
LHLCPFRGEYGFNATKRERHREAMQKDSQQIFSEDTNKIQKSNRIDGHSSLKEKFYQYKELIAIFSVAIALFSLLLSYFVTRDLFNFHLLSIGDRFAQHQDALTRSGRENSCFRQREIAELREELYKIQQEMINMRIHFGDRNIEELRREMERLEGNRRHWYDRARGAC